ncbi:MAG: phosphoethanolamine--lipid A transferase, partial [Comamonadaceae bacterium]
MSPRRPSLHTETLVLLAALYLLAACNGPFWRAALAGRDWSAPGTWALAGAMFVSFSAAYVAFTALLATRWTVKPLLSLLVLVAAALSYYMDRYSIFFDRSMLRNVLATNPGEARELLGWDFVLHMLLFGAVPAALLWWPALRRRPPARAALVRSGWILGGFALMVAALLPVFADFASLMRNNREMRFLLNPGNAVAAVVAEIGAGRGRPAQLQPVGEDARMAPTWPQRRRTLFVLVVGETARAQNFGLDGYSRQTTPELARRDVVNFPLATACGTSTEVSLPCMFSPFGRRNYDEDTILSHESLLHVLHRAGIEVLWRDNQSGCKGVCAGLRVQEMARTLAPELCPDGQCFDEALLHDLDQVAVDARGNLFVVLHQLGSHGPAYYKRYPPAFKRFTPACEQEELRRCSQAEIVNAYDNTILYTDHVLGRLVDQLQALDAKLDTAMLYVSDHGESLGESGLYLHGVPYAIAPQVQTHVPMVAWASAGFVRSTGLDLACLRQRAALPVSHDNLFHSVLGAMDVQT